jgi:siroheme synthase (precorrin-2 oxidase/ferrochelatase)
VVSVATDGEGLAMAGISRDDVRSELPQTVSLGLKSAEFPDLLCAVRCLFFDLIRPRHSCRLCR